MRINGFYRGLINLAVGLGTFGLTYNLTEDILNPYIAALTGLFTTYVALKETNANIDFINKRDYDQKIQDMNQKYQIQRLDDLVPQSTYKLVE